MAFDLGPKDFPKSWRPTLVILAFITGVGMAAIGGYVALQVLEHRAAAEVVAPIAVRVTAAEGDIGTLKSTCGETHDVMIYLNAQLSTKLGFKPWVRTALAPAIGPPR